MGNAVFKQPNGLYGRYSYVSDNFTNYNMTKEEYIVSCAVANAISREEWDFNHNQNFTDYKQVKKDALDYVKCFDEWIKDAEDDVEYLCNESTWVIYNEETLKSCLNTRTNCASLPATWKTGSGEDMHYDLTIPLSYLQLHSLYNKKMPVDEKRVLKNLNEYLIKKDIAWGEKERVWEILKIEIGDPEAAKEWDEHFFQVPVDVEIEFKTVEGLIGFLYNVEKKLIDEWEDRILYKIQSVSYDIVTRDEPQVTDISMIAYYYHDEKFIDKKECVKEDEITNGTGDTKELEEESGWIVQDVLNWFR